MKEIIQSIEKPQTFNERFIMDELNLNNEVEGTDGECEID